MYLIAKKNCCVCQDVFCLKKLTYGFGYVHEKKKYMVSHSGNAWAQATEEGNIRTQCTADKAFWVRKEILTDK